MPKIKVEVIAPDVVADKSVSAITKVAQTGQVGDGKIFISDMNDAVRIRTGETGETVL